MAHQRRSLFSDCAHFRGAAIGSGRSHIENRSDMQGADRGMGIPGTLSAVTLEDLGEPCGVVGQMLERHRTVLDEGNRFAVAFHRHHDVQAGLANLPERLLTRLIGELPDRAGQSEIGHQLHQTGELQAQLIGRVARKLDQQHCLGFAHQR